MHFFLMQEDHFTKVLRNNKVSCVAVLEGPVQWLSSAQRSDSSAESEREGGRKKERDLCAKFAYSHISLLTN